MPSNLIISNRCRGISISGSLTLFRNLSRPITHNKINGEKISMLSCHHEDKVHSLHLHSHHHFLWCWPGATWHFFLFSRGKGNLVTDVSMINAKFIYIKYIFKNDLTWQWFKHQSLLTLLTFAHICIQCVVGCACCAIPRNIAVTALIDITSGCKNKIITMSTTSCYCWLFYHITKRFSRM